MSSTIESTQGRSFIGTVGLKAGFDASGMLHERTEIVNECNAWIQRRHAERKPFLSFIIGPAEEILYGFDEPSGFVLRSEPVVRISGEVPAYHESLSDKEIIEALSSLFERLAFVCEQTTVRFTYWGEGSFRSSYRLRLPDRPDPLNS